MENQYLLRVEHNEYAKRMEDEHERQNARIKELEESVKQYGELTLAVSQLAQSVEHMCKKQDAHTKRLEALESRDGEMWRKVTSHIIMTLVGAAAAYFLTKLGL